MDNNLLFNLIFKYADKTQKTKESLLSFCDTFNFLSNDQIIEFITNFNKLNNIKILNANDLKKLKDYIYLEIKNKIYDSNNSLFIINFIINYYNNGDLFEVINNIISYYNIELSLDDVNILLDNDLIKCEINTLVGNKKSISSDNYIDITNNYFANLIIDIYLEKNNIRVVDKTTNIYSDSVYTREEEIAVFKAFNNGENVINEIINHNLRLVKKIAYKYSSFAEADDLIQEGSIGLLEAINRYDYTKGFKFSTYATWWIRVYIQRYIQSNGTIIRLPKGAYELKKKIRQYSNKVLLETGIDAKPEDIAKYLNIPIKNVNEILINNGDSVSLNQTVNDDTDTSLESFIYDEDDNDYDKQIYDKELSKIFNLAFEALTPTQRYILENHWGLNGKHKLILEEIAKPLNITRERVRQIESSALSILKNPKIKNTLKSFYDDGVSNEKSIKTPPLKEIFKNCNVNIFNLFLTFLDDQSYHLFSELYDNLRINKANTSSIENYILEKQIAKFFNLNSFLYHDDSLRIIGNLINNPNKFNIYNYIDLSDNYSLEFVLGKLNKNLFNYFNCHFDIETGYYHSSQNVLSFTNIINLINNINKIIKLYGVPKTVNDNQIKEASLSLFDIIGDTTIDEFNIILASLSKTDFNIFNNLFGLNFNNKICEENYNEYIGIFNKIDFIKDYWSKNGDLSFLLRKRKANQYIFSSETDSFIIDYIYSLDKDNFNKFCSIYNLDNGEIINEKDLNMDDYSNIMGYYKSFELGINNIIRYFNNLTKDEEDYLINNLNLDDLKIYRNIINGVNKNPQVIVLLYKKVKDLLRSFCIENYKNIPPKIDIEIFKYLLINKNHYFKYISTNCFMAFYLKYVKNYNIELIASILNINESLVKVEISKFYLKFNNASEKMCNSKQNILKHELKKVL